MEGSTLVDMYCPDAHQAAVTAAALDASSGARITADAYGTVAITQPGQKQPAFVFSVGAAVYGCVAVAKGGAMVAVGDENGTIAVYKTYDGQCVFYDAKDDGTGPERAMRACAFNPQGTQVACLSIDGVVRVFNIARWERVANWNGFAGESVEFDARGERLLVIDTLGQPKLLDMVSQEQMDLQDTVPGGVIVAAFLPDGEHFVTLGMSGLNVLNLPDGQIVNSFSPKGGSQPLNLALSPEGDRVAVASQRSIHTFSLPGLDPGEGWSHNVTDATKALLWDERGVAIGGADARMHHKDEKPSLPNIVCCTGYGDFRIGVYGDRVAVWELNRMKRPFNAKKNFVECKVDRDGRIILGLPDDGSGMQVFEAKTGRFLFTSGPETANTSKMEVGGTIVACMLDRGGLRWWDLKQNNVFELPWVKQFSLSGGGTWLGVTTPKGAVKVLDPATGKDAIPAPEPLASVPAKLLSFVNKRPNMLVLDEEGVLSTYDLSVSVTEGRPAKGRDLLDFQVAVDRLWGITGGKYAAVRFQEPDKGTATVITVDLDTAEVVAEVPNLLPYCWVDPESGYILQPGRGGAIQEFDLYGVERRILRSLPEGEWISFGPSGVMDASDQK